MTNASQAIEAPPLSAMREYLSERASVYGNVSSPEGFADHVLRNYSPEQWATYGETPIEAAYNLLRERVG